MIDKVVYKQLTDIKWYWTGSEWCMSKRIAKRYYSERGLKTAVTRRINALGDTHYNVDTEDYTDV